MAHPPYANSATLPSLRRSFHWHQNKVRCRHCHAPVDHPRMHIANSHLSNPALCSLCFSWWNCHRTWWTLWDVACAARGKTPIGRLLSDEHLGFHVCSFLGFANAFDIATTPKMTSLSRAALMRARLLGMNMNPINVYRQMREYSDDPYYLGDKGFVVMEYDTLYYVIAMEELAR